MDIAPSFDKGTEFFKGRTLLIATKHGKESVMAKIFERRLGVKCLVPPGLDTDLFGTFSGEVNRPDSALATARKKCLYAMEHYSYDLVIASEGSFGAHPNLPFLPADEELLLLLDSRNDLEISDSVLTTDTNFSGEEVRSLANLEDFATRAGFPSHGIIMKDSESNFVEVVKDIRLPGELKTHFLRMQKKYGRVFLETDMRAYANPTRMKIIRQAAEQMVNKILTCCPSCGTPGFGITDCERGLPCMNCHASTRGILSYTFSCKKCGTKVIHKYPHHIKFEDPAHCDFCNP